MYFTSFRCFRICRLYLTYIPADHNFYHLRVGTKITVYNIHHRGAAKVTQEQDKYWSEIVHFVLNHDNKIFTFPGNEKRKFYFCVMQNKRKFSFSFGAKFPQLPSFNSHICFY